MNDQRPVAIVTGAGSGIGRQVAVALASAERGGHRVALVGRRPEPLVETGRLIGIEGEDWIALSADIADPDQAGALPGRVVDAFGRLDVLVNNAGWTPMKPVWEHTPAEVHAIFGVNAIGPVLTTIAALRMMRTQNAGRIVSVSSMASGDPFPGLSVYGGAKAAINTLTKGIANELGPDSPIRVFCIAPGAVETPLLRSILSEDQLPSDACLTPDDVAKVIVECATGSRDDESGGTIWLSSDAN